MTKLLIVTPCWLDDAPKAEALIDFVFHQNARQKQGHALILVGPDVHPEYVERLKISADITFEGRTIFHIPPWAKPPANKFEGVNYMLYAAAKLVQDRFNWPWLWVEPDCVPLKQGWLEQLSQAYHGQPKRYMGMTLTLKPKDQPDAQPVTFLTRTAVYPPDAILELETLCKQPTFMERNSVILDKATRSTLIQSGHYDAQTTTIRDDAVLFHGDKQHELLAMLRDKLYPARNNGLTPLGQALSHGQPKIDGRTKAARALKQFKFAGT